MRLTLEKFRWILIAVLIAVLSACSGGGTATSNPTPSAPMSNLGTLSNGSMVWITNNTLPVIPSKSTNALISITGGTTNDPYTISFESTVVQPFQVSNAKNVISSIVNESNGITVTTTPATCIIAVGSNSYPGSCPVKITVAPNTPAGIYLITPIATDQSNTQQVLSPIRVLVNGSTSLSANAITSFDFTLPSGAITSGVINGQNISVVVPAGTNVSNLVAQYVTTGVSISVGGITQVNSVSGNNFTSPLQYVVKAANGSTQNYTVIVTVAPSSAKAITAFSINDSNGIIDGQNIYVTLPFGTDITNLNPTFTSTGESVSINGTLQVSGVTSNDFTSPVLYTVTAADSSTQNYTVTVIIAPNTANEITTFSLNGTQGIIVNQNITVEMPYGSNISDLIATFTTTGESVSISGKLQVSGITSNDFTSPIVYTVTAANGATQNYTVTVIVAPNTAKDILSFSLNTSPSPSSGVITPIDESSASIAVVVPYGTDLSALIATFSTNGESVNISGTPQVSSVTTNNFSSPLVYTVTAADGTTKNYTVVVTIAPNNVADILSYSINGNDGIITESKIAVKVPYGTNLTIPLIAKFQLSPGAKSTVNVLSINVPQISGITPNSFANPVVYTVTAADGTTIKQYTVTVTVGPADADTMVTFSLRGSTGLLIAGKIDDDQGTITVDMPWKTYPNFLVASFTTGGAESVTVAYTFESQTYNIPQFSGYSPIFGSPVVYTVHAPNGTFKNYTVTVNIPEFAFTNFSLVDLGTLGYFSGVITQPTESQPIGTILVQVPYGTNTNLAANWVDSLDINRLIANPVFVGNPLDLNLQIPLVSTNDYTNPVTLNVLALPFYMATYVVTESIAVPANNVFTSYYLTVGNKSYPGVINQQGLQKTIQVEVPVGTDVSAAVATFTTYGAATVTVPKIGIPPYTVQTSGVTINNFSKGAVNYTVTSGINTNLYAVTVINPTP